MKNRSALRCRSTLPAAALLSCCLTAACTDVASAGEPANGCDPQQARAFDFWIGEWDIDQRILGSDGSWIELPASTLVEPVLDGSALLERWQGNVQFFWRGMTAPEPMTGFSFRACNARDDRWYIHWADSLTPGVGRPYAGTFANGRGVFFRESAAEGRLERITFADITVDSVCWALAVSNDGGRTWTDVWTMAMHRRAGPSVAGD